MIQHGSWLLILGALLCSSCSGSPPVDPDRKIIEVSQFSGDEVRADLASIRNELSRAGLMAKIKKEPPPAFELKVDINEFEKDEDIEQFCTFRYELSNEDASLQMEFEVMMDGPLTPAMTQEAFRFLNQQVIYALKNPPRKSRYSR